MIITNFKLRTAIYKIVHNFYQLVDLGGMHPVRQRARIALEETVEYISKNMPSALGFNMFSEVLDYALRHSNIEGHFIEFGVYKGASIKYLAKRIGGRIIYGFDSFQGLPGNWSGFYMDIETLDLKKKLPKVSRNVKLYPGWFDQTIPSWLEEYKGPIAFIHIDCDIYDSTKTIFEFLGARIKEGTVIVFDEYFNYPGWQQHEYKAFQEFVLKNRITYEYLAYARNQVAVKILTLG